ncbi:protein kinase [Paenibacillus sp. S150]|uniref:protein kinase domain-containing protein n=1 Tax=Paenibacillus sp. S150 TaxID=2749826 RepID=UPI001C59B16D|nr:protein kinase [Paenibacillus sp. S150]MBW4081263.1 protein kinase [Paenibacillus sp. S150]
MESSLHQLVEIFRNINGFNRVFLLFRQKYRSYGRITKSTKVILEAPTPDELRVLNGFLGSTYGKEEVVSIAAGKMEKEIRNSKYRELFDGYDLNDFLEMYYGGELTSKSEDKHRYNEEKMKFFQTLLSENQMESSFYQFISFIKTYKNAPSIHIMYKKSPELLNQLLELINKLFDYLPLSSNIYLPLLAYELTDNFYALNPKSDGGKMLLLALQVLNHLTSESELISKPNEEQIKEILRGYNIIYCPEANRKTHRLWISVTLNEEENSYQLIPLKKIGEGSFAEVYRVFDPVLKSELACKVLFERSNMFENNEADGNDPYLRFKREIKFLKDKVSHPNIIEISKIQLVNEPVFFTMPLADASLDEWLGLNSCISEEVRISIFKDILNGVDYLHDRKISHRDLAPHNILLFKESDGSILVKVADFGLAKDKHSLSKSTGLFVNGYGRAGYTAPEQLNSLKSADHLSDIYSLGAMLYYLLSGKSPEERYRRMVTHQLIIMKAMEEDRTKRYQTTKELIDDINLIDRKSMRKENSPFYSLETYKFKDFSADVNYVLQCISSVQIEDSDRVIEKFIVPFKSIPINVFMECAKYDALMIPFVHMTEENISNVTNTNEVDWDQVSLLIDCIYYESQNIALQINVTRILMNIALKFNNLTAQSLLVGILVSMNSFTLISQQVAFIIETNYSEYRDLLKCLLQEIEHPHEIQEVLNDY